MKKKPAKKKKRWAAWPEVWLVDPLGRQAPSLQEELARREVAGRKVVNVATMPNGNEPWPRGVFFCSDDNFSAAVLGYLWGRRKDVRGRAVPIVWESSRGTSIANFWRGKTVLLKSSAPAGLARAMAYQIRRARP